MQQHRQIDVICAPPERLFGSLVDVLGRFPEFRRTYPVSTGSRMPYSVKNLAALRMLEAIVARP